MLDPGRRQFIALFGGAAAWPLAARAQQAGKIPTVICGTPVVRRRRSHILEHSRKGSQGWATSMGATSDSNTAFPNEMPERFKSMAAELVALNVDVLMGGAIASSYLRDATTKIPIVFMFVPDPVGMRFVQSIAKPGGNITGLSNFGRDIAGKRLQLLKELVPGLTRVALLINSDQQTTPVFVEVMGAAADQLGLPFQLPTKYDLVINVKTARALGLKIPPNLLFTAEEVIE